MNKLEFQKNADKVHKVIVSSVHSANVRYICKYISATDIFTYL